MRSLLHILVFLQICQRLCLAEVRTLVVLPFANESRTPGLHWMSECFPELLEERLKWPGLNILGREERLLAFDRIGIPYTRSLSKASSIKIGQELDAGLLVLGAFESDGKKLEVSLSVLDLRDNLLKPVIQETGDLEQFQTICGRLGWKILSQIDPTFPMSLDSYLGRFPVIPNLALENYVRGLIESDRESRFNFSGKLIRAIQIMRKRFFNWGNSITRKRTIRPLLCGCNG